MSMNVDSTGPVLISELFGRKFFTGLLEKLDNESINDNRVVNEVSDDAELDIRTYTEIDSCPAAFSGSS